jgi:ACS family sodium-dependent inorganic phosphate cotransporter
MFSLAVVWVLSYFDRVNLSVAVIPMQAEFGWPETQKGLLLAAVFVGYIVSQTAGGWLVQRFGALRLLSIALLGFSSMTLLTPLAARHSFELLVALRTVLGLFEGLASPASYAMIGRWSAPNERARMLAIVLSGATLGAPLGLMLSGVLVERFGWQYAFYMFGAVGFIWALLWRRMAHEDPDQHPRISEAERTLLAQSRIAPAVHGPVPYFKVISHPAVLAAGVAKFSMGWTIYVLLTWLPSYYSAVHGISISGSGIFSALPWITLTALLHITSRVSDGMLRKGHDVTFVRKLMQTIGIGGTLVCVTGIPLARDVTGAVLLTCGAIGCLSFCYSGVEPAAVEMAPRYRAYVTGFAATIGNLPGLVAVPVTGWIVERTGSYAGGFYAGAVVGVIGLVTWLLFGTGKKVID